eukprot:3345510-Amphidinium_carterae.1
MESRESTFKSSKLVSNFACFQRLGHGGPSHAKSVMLHGACFRALSTHPGLASYRVIQQLQTKEGSEMAELAPF